MIGLTTCIIHSNVATTVQLLDEMLVVDADGHAPGILLLLGLPKTGKDRILNYWRKHEHWDGERRAAIEQPPIVYSEVWKSQADSLGRKVYATPITCVTFSEIAYGLGRLSQFYTPTYAGKKWYREPKSLYTDPQFASLFSFVREEVQRLRIRAIVINNAQTIDARTLEMLMLLRKHCHNQVSFIISAQMVEKEDLDEPLAEAFAAVPDAAEVCRRVVLQRLSKKEYKAVVLPALTEQLNLAFADELLEEVIAKRVPEALWRHTKFDWKAIDDLAKAIKRRVPDPQNGRQRKLTRALLEDILGRSLV